MPRSRADLAVAFRAHWERHFALPAGSTLVAAVSGGIDSMVMLALLARERIADASVVAAHFDHKTRGRQSAEDGRFVSAVARRWGARVVRGRGDAPARAAEKGSGPQAAARDLRYAFLRGVVKQKRAAALVTAHQRDDLVETVLLRVVRGTSPDGLAPLAPLGRRPGALLFRPLLPFSRAAIAAWAQATGVPFREDPSNRAPGTPRGRLRHDVLPLLSELNPRFDEAVVRLSVLAGADAAYLRRAAGDILRAATLENGRTEWRLEASRLAAAPDPLLSRALVQAWAWGAPRGTPPPGAEWVEGAMEFLRGGRGGRVACPGGGSMRRSRGVVEFTRVEHGPEVEDA